MIKKIKAYIISLVIMFGVTLPLAPTTLVFAQCASSGGNNPIANSVTQGVNGVGGSNNNVNCAGVGSGIESIAKTVINIFSVVVGVVSVIMIIYAGFRYVTSGGESGNVTNAKNTLVYAIIGLVLVVISQLIVHYVLNSAASIGSGA